MIAGRVVLDEKVLQRDVEHRLTGAVRESKSHTRDLNDVLGPDGDAGLGAGARLVDRRGNSREAMRGLDSRRGQAGREARRLRFSGGGGLARCGGASLFVSADNRLERRELPSGLDAVWESLSNRRGSTVRLGVDSPRLDGTLAPGPRSSGDGAAASRLARGRAATGVVAIVQRNAMDIVAAAADRMGARIVTLECRPRPYASGRREFIPCAHLGDVVLALTRERLRDPLVTPERTTFPGVKISAQRSTRSSEAGTGSKSGSRCRVDLRSRMARRPSGWPARNVPAR